MSRGHLKSSGSGDKAAQKAEEAAKAGDDVLIHNTILHNQIADLRSKLTALNANLDPSNKNNGNDISIDVIRNVIDAQIKGLEDLQGIVESQQRSINRDFDRMEKEFIEKNKLRQQVKELEGKSTN